MITASTYLAKIADGRRRLRRIVRSPTAHNAIGPHAAGMVRAATHLKEASRRRFALAERVFAPANDRSVEFHAACVIATRTDLLEASGRRLAFAKHIAAPANRSAVALNTARVTIAGREPRIVAHHRNALPSFRKEANFARKRARAVHTVRHIRPARTAADSATAMGGIRCREAELAAFLAIGRARSVRPRLRGFGRFGVFAIFPDRQRTWFGRRRLRRTRPIPIRTDQCSASRSHHHEQEKMTLSNRHGERARATHRLAQTRFLTPWTRRPKQSLTNSCMHLKTSLPTHLTPVAATTRHWPCGPLRRGNGREGKPLDTATPHGTVSRQWFASPSYLRPGG